MGWRSLCLLPNERRPSTILLLIKLSLVKYEKSITLRPMFYCPVSRLLLCMLPSRDNGALMQSEICPAKWVAGLSKAYPVRVYVGIASQRSELHIDFSHEILRQRMHVDRVLPLFAEGPKENSSFKKQTSKQQTKNPCSTNSAVPSISLCFFLLLTKFLFVWVSVWVCECKFSPHRLKQSWDGKDIWFKLQILFGIYVLSEDKLTPKETWSFVKFWWQIIIVAVIISVIIFLGEVLA